MAKLTFIRNDGSYVGKAMLNLLKSYKIYDKPDKQTNQLTQMS